MNRLLRLLLPAFFATGAFAAFNVTSFLSCIVNDPVAGTITAYFGYESFEPAAVTIPFGSDNRFVPPPANRSQPSLFLPGYHEKSFRVTYPVGSLLYIFNGAGITVNQHSPVCASTIALPPALPALPPATALVPYSQRLTAIGGLSAPSWSVIGNLPAGLGLSAEGVLAGTPQIAGPTSLTVQATDGFTTSQQSYSLIVGNGVTISDAASTRAPGFTPQFRVVTNVASGITATASCDTTEFVITGGGGCTVPNSNTVQGRIATSGPATNGWTVTCSGGAANAAAICSRY